jgi:hypothetical protein
MWVSLGQFTIRINCGLRAYLNHRYLSKFILYLISQSIILGSVFTEWMIAIIEQKLIVLVTIISCGVRTSGIGETVIDFVKNLYRIEFFSDISGNVRKSLDARSRDRK